MTTAPVNAMPTITVTGSYAPVAPIPVVVVPNDGSVTKLAQVAAQQIVELAPGTPYAQVAPIPIAKFTAGSRPAAPTAPIPVVIVG